MDFFIFMAVFLTLVFVPISIYAYNNGKKADELKALIHDLPGFDSCEVLCAIDVAIAANPSSGSFGLAWRADGKLSAKVLPASALIRIDIERIGSSSSTKKSGFTKFSTESFATRIILCVQFRDQDMPILRIPMYGLTGKPNGGTKGKEAEAMKRVQRWESILMGTGYATSKSPVDSKTITRKRNNEVGSEIKVLHELFQSGALTEAEFQEAKAKVIGVL